ncbi:helix-turn-helix transcriptional regulator [Kutzneria sp. 744]|uniref:helix-turn-helix domain-containing protein n=1 Tax=Kutzneria sp. (strain 744) TaxID=345341 RepID=UPI0003EECF46|nr:helix-turn-helix transcriptional regulator [Kutzneria sp. 744]EWM19287.1 epstein-Barr nuclear antigen 1 [Kutzneria sp. 744]
MTRVDPLPESVWNAHEVRDAVASNSPSAVIAFARRAHGLRQDELGALAGFSQSAISRLESGSNLAYDVRVLRIVQRTLNIPPRLLGLAEQGVATAELRHHGGTEALVALLGGRMERTAPATPEIVGQLLVARRVINDADNWRVSAALRPAARELYEFTDLLRRSASGEMRRILLSVAALYAEFVGWLHEEGTDEDGAEQWTARAMQQAQAAEDRDMVAYAYVRMSELAAGDHDRMIGLARAAQREPGIGAVLKVLALQQEARGLALAQDEAACLDRLEQAALLIDGVVHPATDEYRVGYWTDIEHLAALRASCLLDLGRPQEAIDIYHHLRPRWGHVCSWFQGVHTAKLARAYATNGDLDEATTAGVDAAALARVSGSPHVVRELRALAPWPAVSMRIAHTGPGAGIDDTSGRPLPPPS